VGGRIHTATEKLKRNGGGEEEQEVTVRLDHGAAWVHGTGLEWGQHPLDDGNTVEHVPTRNPMMGLLQRATPAEGESVYSYHLNPIFVSGNPWTRPRTVAHEASEMAIYVDGQLLGNSSDDGGDAFVISEALRIHFSILREVSKEGNRLYSEGRGTETTRLSLQQAIDRVRGTAYGDDDDDEGARRRRRNYSEETRRRIEALVPFYQHLLECWYGSPAAELQLCEFVDEDRCAGDAAEDSEYSEVGDFFGAHCTLKYGMQAVLEPLLGDGVKEQVLLNHEVVEIRKLENGLVEVISSNGARTRAKVCVVTVSAGCLAEAAADSPADSGGAISFEPPLSPAKKKAIASTQMGSYKKVFLTFDGIFWPRNEAFIGMVRAKKAEGATDPLGNFLLMNNLWARDGIPCIEAVLFGTSGRWATHKSDDVIRGAVLRFMSDALGPASGNIADRCLNCHVTRWEEDRFSRGSYSSVAMGAQIRHVEELTEPEWGGQLLLAGEATVTEFEGSVHAALFSGKRAAGAVQRFLARDDEAV